MNAQRPQVLSFWDATLGAEIHGKLTDVADVVVHPPDRGYLLECLDRFDAHLASLALQYDAEVLERAQRLKVLATPSTGLDHIDVDRVEQLGIELVHLRTETDLLDQVTATAELAWGLMLAVVRKIPAGLDDVRAGRWGRDRFRGTQLSGKTLGILGVGRLGKMVAAYGRAFRMRVIGCDHGRVDALGVEPVDLDTLLRTSDVLSIHIHLTPENVGLLGPAQFAAMKTGAVLINTSRGGMLDEAALLDALETGKLAAAGLDVISGEWRDDLADHPLVRYARMHDNLVITPHVGGVTYESQRMTTTHVANKVAALLTEHTGA